ncbi:hypothetical protein EBR25_08195 [bacterium]|jgi:hypothetical protein|nr:hypothetical protein [bacterium]
MNLKTLIFYMMLPVISFSLLGCGHYGPPQPPERFAPAAVLNISTTSQADGVTLQWRSPEKNLQGKPLEDLQYFDIRRTDLRDIPQFRKDPIKNSISVGTVNDKAIADFVARRSKARSNKTPLRKEKINPELIQYDFFDGSVVRGESYLYSIVPMTKGDIPGKVEHYVRVRFSGTESEITLLDSDIFDRPYALAFPSRTLP